MHVEARIASKLSIDDRSLVATVVVHPRCAYRMPSRSFNQSVVLLRRQRHRLYLRSASHRISIEAPVYVGLRGQKCSLLMTQVASVKPLQIANMESEIHRNHQGKIADLACEAARLRNRDIHPK